jgi:guanylate kinase
VTTGAEQPHVAEAATDAATEPAADCLETDGIAEGAPGAVLVIISGPSGVGKDTIIDALKRRHRRHGGPRQHDHHFVITCTTRQPRKGEVNGVSYHFVDADKFHHLRESGELLEWANVHGNWYGTPKSEVARFLAKGADVILKIDVQGAQKVKERVDDAILIFVVPPSLETLFQRLRARATESAEELEIRQRNAAIELARAENYDYVVRNDDGQVEKTAEAIDAIISREHAARADRRVRL